MKSVLIYVAAGAGALALSLLATSLLEQSTSDDGDQIELRADFSRDAVRETVEETISRIERQRIAADDTRAGRYAATLQSELSGIRGDLSTLLSRIETVANTEPVIEGDSADIPNHDRIAAIVEETVLAQREQQAREREARQQERDLARKEKAAARRKDQLTKRLGLRDDQVPAVLAIYDRFESKQNSIFADLKAGGERISGTQVKEVMTSIQESMNSELSGILDESQYEKYLSSRSRSLSLGDVGTDGGRRSRGRLGAESGARRSRSGGAGGGTGRRRGRDR